MKVAYCLPSTTKGINIDDILKTPLYNVLLQSNPEKDVKYYIGIDYDDPIYSRKTQRKKLNKLYDIEWVIYKGEKGHVTKIWNECGSLAVKHGYEYIYLLGDDIHIDKQPFLKEWIDILHNRKNLGWVAPYSGNDRIPTQFFLHKTHYDIFGWFYNPLIKNWFCDDHLAGLYPHKYITWDKEKKHFNVGGMPRYNVIDGSKLYKFLLKKDKKKIYNYIYDTSHAHEERTLSDN